MQLLISHVYFDVLSPRAELHKVIDLEVWPGQGESVYHGDLETYKHQQYLTIESHTLFSQAVTPSAHTLMPSLFFVILCI